MLLLTLHETSFKSSCPVYSAPRLAIWIYHLRGPDSMQRKRENRKWGGRRRGTSYLDCCSRLGNSTIS